MTTIFKKVAVAGALALALCVSAQATTTNLGTISGTVVSGSNTSGGSFQDLYTFTISSTSVAALVSQAITFSSYGVSLSSLNLYSGTGTSGSSISLVSSAVSSNLGNGIIVDSVSAKTSTALTAGSTYTLAVGGTSQGAAAYTTIIALSPVPEPETYGMLLAGLGVMGFVARRKKLNNKA